MPPLSRLLVVGLACFAIMTTVGRAEEPKHPLAAQIQDAIRELMESMQPALDDVGRMVDVFESIDSLEFYHPPEISADGDIILRRRLDAPPWNPHKEDVPDATPPVAETNPQQDSVDL